MAKVRLQKILARAGIASRRHAEELIVQGRVRIGDKVVTELGTRADPRQEAVFVNGKRIKAEDLIYVLLHKPRGVVCTMQDPEGRQTVAELLHGVPSRIVPVGRLDYETSGVLLLTNDGEFAAALAHPRHKAEKIYVAKVSGEVGEPDLDKFGESILIDGKRTQPAWVRLLRHEGDKSWLEITLKEGKNRHIHRLGEHAGFPVMRLARVSFAGLTAEGLRPGQWRYLTIKELTAFKRSYGFPKTLHAPPPTDTVEQGRVYRNSVSRDAERSLDARSSEQRSASGRGASRSGAAELPHEGPARGGRRLSEARNAASERVVRRPTSAGQRTGGTGHRRAEGATEGPRSGAIRRAERAGDAGGHRRPGATTVERGATARGQERAGAARGGLSRGAGNEERGAAGRGQERAGAARGRASDAERGRGRGAPARAEQSGPGRPRSGNSGQRGADSAVQGTRADALRGPRGASARGGSRTKEREGQRPSTNATSAGRRGPRRG